MGLRGDVGKLRTFKQRLREFPITLAAEVSKAVAPALTDLATGAYDGGRTVYGDTRPKGVEGQALDLEATGATRAQLRFVAVGTVVRCVLGTKWSKYLIGKYGILPNGNAAVPAAWRAKLDAIVAAQKGPAP
jgi:hypothetical protein